MNRPLVLIVACTVLIDFVDASDVPTPVNAPATHVQALIDQLGAEDYSDRESATIKLENIGPAAIHALRSASLSSNPEVRTRAAILANKLQQLKDSKDCIAAKRVTLSYRDIPLGTALADLKKQTGLNIVIDPTRIANPLRRITCEAKDLPIWEALEAFCIAAELREVFLMDLDSPKQRPNVNRGNLGIGGLVPPPIPNADAIPIVLIDGKPDRLPGDRTTAVRVAVLPPKFPGHKVTLGTGEVNLCLDVTPGPGIAWQDVTGVKISRVIDSSGRPGGAGTEKVLPPPAPDQNGMIIFVKPGVAMRIDQMGNSTLPDTVPNPRVLVTPIRVATATATSLKRLEGAVFGEVLAPEKQLITLNDLKLNTNVAVAGPGEIRFTLLETKEATSNQKGTIRAQVEYPAPWVVNARRRGGICIMPGLGLPEPPGNPNQTYRLEAYDEKGKLISLESSNSMDMNDDGSVIIKKFNCNFSEKGLPSKLLLVGPKYVTVQIPFVLENVPLP